MSLAMAMVRHRWASFLGTFIALTLGVAVIAGSLLLWASAQPRVPGPLSAAEVLVAAPKVADPHESFPTYRPWSADEVDQLVDRLSHVPGVRAAVADRSFYVQRVVDGAPVGDAQGSLHTGRAWSGLILSPYGLRSGTPPQRAGDVVVDAALGVPVGARLEVLTAAGPETWTVTGTVDGPGFWVDDTTARERAGGVRMIGLRLVPGASADAVAGRLGLGALGSPLTGDERTAAEPTEDARTRWIGAQLIIATVIVGAFVAVFVVASTCAFSASQRRREVGLLRAVGATLGQIRRLLIGEVVLVAVGAGAVGVALGALLAPLLDRPLIAAGLEPSGFHVGISWWALLVAVAAGLLVGVLGVWSSARRSSRAPALDALREAAVERRPMTVLRWVFFALTTLLGGGLVLLIPGSSAEDKPTIVLGSAMSLLVAAALVAPVVVVPLVRLVTWLTRRGATGMLVREGAVVASRRMASTAAPVLAAVGFAVLLVGAFQTAEEAVGIEDASAIAEAAVAAPAGTPGLTEAVVRQLPGRSILPTSVYLADRVVDVAGVDGAVGVVAAPLTGWRVGQRVQVRFEDGSPATLTITDVRDDLPAALVLPRATVRPHDPTAMAPSVYLSGSFAASPGVVQLTAREFVDREAAEEGDLVDLFLIVLLGISVGYTALAVANTLLMATYGRRQEFVTLHRAGATTGQTVRVVIVEALLAVLIGTLLGLAVAVPALFETRAGLQDEIGTPVTLVMPWATLGGVVGVCAVLAVAAVGLPFLRRSGMSVVARTMAV